MHHALCTPCSSWPLPPKPPHCIPFRKDIDFNFTAKKAVAKRERERERKRGENVNVNREAKKRNVCLVQWRRYDSWLRDEIRHR